MNDLPTLKPGVVITSPAGSTITGFDREVEPGPVTSKELQSCRVLFKLDLESRPDVNGQDQPYGSPDPRKLTQRQRMALQAIRRGEGLEYNVDGIYCWLDRVADYMDSLETI